MMIAIDDTKCIRGTSMCWQLEGLRPGKDAPKWVPFKYFATAEQALTAAAQREIRTDPAETIAEALDALNRVTQKYAQLFDVAGEPLANTSVVTA